MIAILIILPVSIISLFIFKFKNNPGITYDKNVILDNEEAYTNIAKLCYEDYLKIGSNNNIYVYGVDYNNKVILRYRDDSRITLSDKQLKDYETIKSTYRLDKQPFDSVIVYDNFVTFKNLNGRAAFVYSVNKEPPIYINSPDDDNTDIHVEKITNYWYYACMHGRWVFR